MPFRMVTVRVWSRLHLHMNPELKKEEHEVWECSCAIQRFHKHDDIRNADDLKQEHSKNTFTMLQQIQHVKTPPLLYNQAHSWLVTEHRASNPNSNCALVHTHFLRSLSFLLLVLALKDCACRSSVAALRLLKALISSSRLLRFSSSLLFSSACSRFSCSNFPCN